MSEEEYSKGFQLTFSNGTILGFWKSISNKKQKSYDLVISNGKDNCFHKVGTVKDIDSLKEIIFDGVMKDE